jgi:hypothetical protein
VILALPVLTCGKVNDATPVSVLKKENKADRKKALDSNLTDQQLMIGHFTL